MSIYATLWEIKLPKSYHFDEEWVSVYAQAVPAHIGHASHYPEGDPYADYLPPVVQNYDPESHEASPYRAVLILMEGRDEKIIQRYTDPLLMMTGEEYARLTFDELIHRIEDAMPWDHDIVGYKTLPDGRPKLSRLSDHSRLHQAVLERE